MRAAHQVVVRTAMARGGVGLDMRAATSPGQGEVLIAVELCGLCGSDAHIWRADDGYEWVEPGRVLGHEVVGVVVELGPGTAGTGIRLGERVVPVAQIGCGECAACRTDYANGCLEKTTLGLSRDGGASEFVIARADSVLPVPAGMTARTAVLTEPASVAARAVTVHGAVSGMDRVVVSGPGAVGILAALICQWSGASVVVLGTPADVAARGDALEDLNLKLVTSVPEGFVPTVWIEASGAGTALDTAITRLPTKGKLIIVALYANAPTVALNVAVRKELSLSTSYSSFSGDYKIALQFLEEHPDLGESLVELHDLREAREAFARIGNAPAPKIALEIAQ